MIRTKTVVPTSSPLGLSPRAFLGPGCSSCCQGVELFVLWMKICRRGFGLRSDWLYLLCCLFWAFLFISFPIYPPPPNRLTEATLVAWMRRVLASTTERLSLMTLPSAGNLALSWKEWGGGGRVVYFLLCAGCCSLGEEEKWEALGQLWTHQPEPLLFNRPNLFPRTALVPTLSQTLGRLSPM